MVTHENIGEGGTQRQAHAQALERTPYAYHGN